MRKVWKIKVVYSFMTQYFAQNINKEDDFILTIKKKKKTRTLQENKLIHVLIQMFVDEEKKLWNEYEFEEMKNIMKMALIWVKEIQLWEFVVQYPKKWTSDLTVEEWIRFIEKMIFSLNERYKLKIQSKDDERLLDYYDQNIQ